MGEFLIRRVLIYAICALLLTSPVPAQSAEPLQVTISVANSEGEPVAGAAFKMSGTFREAISTSTSGTVVMKLDPGLQNFDLSVPADNPNWGGFANFKLSLQISGGEQNAFTIKLPPPKTIRIPLADFEHFGANAIPVFNGQSWNVLASLETSRGFVEIAGWQNFPRLLKVENQDGQKFAVATIFAPTPSEYASDKDGDGIQDASFSIENVYGNLREYVVFSSQLEKLTAPLSLSGTPWIDLKIQGPLYSGKKANYQAMLMVDGSEYTDSRVKTLWVTYPSSEELFVFSFNLGQGTFTVPKTEMSFVVAESPMTRFVSSIQNLVPIPPPSFSGKWFGDRYKAQFTSLPKDAIAKLVIGKRVLSVKKEVQTFSFPGAATITLIVNGVKESTLRIPSKFATCKEMWEYFDGGISKSSTYKNKGAKLKKAPTTYSGGYAASSKLDKDKDGLVCER